MKNFCLVSVLSLSGLVTFAGEPAREIVAKAGEKVMARVSSGPACGIIVKDAKKAKACDKMLEAVVLTENCGKEVAVSFRAQEDCDDVKSVTKRKGYTKVKLCSGKQVELREKEGCVEVDYDR